MRTTLFIPVRALPGYGDGDIQATISGLALPEETVADQHKQWKIGVRPAFPAQTVNYGTALQPGETRRSRLMDCKTSRLLRWKGSYC